MVLSGCTTAQPLRIEYPLPPSKLMEPSPELEKVPEGTSDIESVSKVIIRNYSLYQREVLKLELLQNWVQTLHEISNGIKK
jgi:hypothetical protein